MSIPTHDPIFPEEDPKITPHRRSTRRSMVPTGNEERSAYLEQVIRTLTPGVDFYIFSVVAGFVFIMAAWLDAASLFFLAALLAPFLGPVFGLPWSIVIGSGRFFLKQAASFVVACILVFALGALGGLGVRWLPGEFSLTQLSAFTLFAWPDFIVLAVGAGLGAYMLARSPRQKPLVASVALAYELLLPLGAAGFGLSAGLPGMGIEGGLVFAVHLTWAALVGLVVLFAMRQRPANLFGVALGVAIVLLGGVLAAVLLLNSQTPAPVIAPTATFAPTLTVPTQASAPTSAATQTQTLPPSATPRITLTASIMPSSTPTETVTPQPTPVWARVSAPSGNGAFVREEPDGIILTSLLNGNAVQVISNPQTDKNGVIWVQVKTDTGITGWMVQNLLATATPAPQW